MKLTEKIIKEIGFEPDISKYLYKYTYEGGEILLNDKEIFKMSLNKLIYYMIQLAYMRGQTIGRKKLKNELHNLITT